MEIAVCLNRVPESSSRIELQNGHIEASCLNMVLNPYDEYAIEEAVRLKEQFGGTSITAFSVGDKTHEDILRKAFAMGVDNACLVEGGKNDDSYLVAASLNKAIRETYRGKLPELVLCGKESSDYNRGQVPLMLAELLGAAGLSAVTKLEMHGKNLKVRRETEGAEEEYELRTPAVISTEKGLNLPRKTNIKAVLQAKKKPITHLDVSPLDASPKIRYEEFSAIHREKNCRFFDAPEDIVQALHEKGIIES